MQLIYKLNPKAYIEVTDNKGIMVLDPLQKNILLLGEFEGAIFSKALGLSEQQLVDVCISEYEGLGIADDVRDFLHTLLQYDILIQEVDEE